jgi:hypothetical protein
MYHCMQHGDGRSAAVLDSTSAGIYAVASHRIACMHLPQRLVVLLAREAKMAGEAIKKSSLKA